MCFAIRQTKTLLFSVVKTTLESTCTYSSIRGFNFQQIEWLIEQLLIEVNVEISQLLL